MGQVDVFDLIYIVHDDADIIINASTLLALACLSAVIPIVSELILNVCLIHMDGGMHFS